MRKELIIKYKKTIAPATKLEHLYLDHSKSLSFSDCYVFGGQVIGAGGFGVVVSATDKHSREDVAIKILNIELYMSAGAEEEEETLDDAMKLKVERRLNFLETEVSIMQELEHSSIIKVKKIYKSQYHVLIVMELAKCSLADYIEKHGRLTEEESKIVLRQILDGLKYLHISNIVHRDLKPGNILLMSDKNLEGTVKISDFSISAKLTKALHFELTDTVGTFLYKAPEQFDSSLCTTYSDVWPAGVILYEMLTGSHPFFYPDESKRDYIARINNPHYYPPARLPQFAGHLFLHLCSPKPSSRYSTTDALEHPWFGEGAKFPLTFDEVLPWNVLKPAVVAALFAVGARMAAKEAEAKAVTVAAYKTARPPTNKLDKERVKMERRKRYSNVVKFITQTPKFSKTINEYELAQAELKASKFGANSRGTPTSFYVAKAESKTLYGSLLVSSGTMGSVSKPDSAEKVKIQKASVNEVKNIRRPLKYKSGKLPVKL
eukprot:TRINITY_DN828_c0_g1_i14.p1 TRINITY_DN828_c0_g1~~TRINITY_DN828_c0_g1_i14.p1  ORF type:complete len:490 (-),score=127.65 TRINITY_DN828_c0_g1_i14:99-1568(-)